jgi:hypothetical protein
MLGVPVYFFKNVQSVLYPAYKKVREDKHRSYPLHIEASWEAEPGLPDLDPVEIRRAEERRKAEDVQKASKAARGARVRAFTLAAFFGVVTRDDGYVWCLSGAKGKLADLRGAAFAAFDSLDPTLRDDLEAEAKRAFSQATADRPGKAEFVFSLKAHAAALKGLYAQAIAEQKDAEKLFLAEERASVDALVAELGG